MTLLFVESPNKTQKIEHLLGPGYKVLASVGHIMDLDPKNMSIDVNDNFKPTYIINSDKINVVKNLKAAAKKATNIMIATDKDREGEMIAWSIADVLKLKNPKRISFIEITKAALTEAVNKPGKIDNNMVDAQKARRILDRIVGYELSPVLLDAFGQGNLSAGRVQSVVARLIVDREDEISKFMANPLNSFFKFRGIFLSEDKQFTANLYDLEGKNTNGFYKGSVSKIDGKDKAKTFLTNCMISIFTVAYVFDKKRIQGPSPPFTTSTLQQDANRKMGFSGKRTMSAAQRLYEAGYITYMRTDSVCLSEEALENIQKYVVDTYGNNYHKRTEYKSKTKNTQEAHEAIRPTDVFVNELDEGGKIGNDEIKLYSLIWKRTVASQMQPAEFNITSIQIEISKMITGSNKYFFMTNIENMTFNGFLIVYNIANLEKDDDDDESTLNKNICIPKVGTELKVDNICGNQDFIKPPGRYDYASLTDKLDPKNLNIGRPATYVSIIEKIINRQYVKISDCPGKETDSLSLTWKYNDKNIVEQTSVITLGKDKNKYVPTHLGIMITYYLIKNFPTILDYKFTGLMEDKLDDVAAGDLIWHDVVKEFYDMIHPVVMKIKFPMGYKSKLGTEIDKYTKLLGVHPASGSEIYVSMGQYGPVYKLMPQLGKAKYAPIKEPYTIETATLENAIKTFEYPKELGKYAKKNITLQTGQYGFYLIHDTKKYNIGDKNTITLNEAIDVIKKKNLETPVFKSEAKEYQILTGQFGKYIKVTDNKTQKSFNVSMPPNANVEELTLERVHEITIAKYNKPAPVANADDTPPIVFKTETKEYKILTGQFGKYIRVTDNKTKKGINVPLSPNENINELTVERLHELVVAKYTKIKQEIENDSSKNQIDATIVKKKILRRLIKKLPVRKHKLKKKFNVLTHVYTKFLFYHLATVVE